jgi:4,5-dihydroxyphthalate decarboxylase
MSEGAAPPSLRAVLKRYPHTNGLISGEIRDPRVSLDWVNVEPIYRAFAPMARSQVYDVSEMAIVTYLQARAYDKPIFLLPTVVASRLQQKCIVYNRKRRAMTLADLPGARVGVRAYSQTTGMWVRAILAGTYGIATDRIRWVTFEEGHLAEYEDPPFVTRMPEGANMLDMLRDGDLDAAIFGNDLPKEDGIEPLIPNPAEADQAWYETHCFVPINHVVVMKRATAEAHPEAAAAVYQLLKLGKAAVPPAAGPIPNALPDGVAALRRPLEMILRACEEQRLLPRPLTTDELFAEGLAYLGDAAQ